MARPGTSATGDATRDHRLNLISNRRFCVRGSQRIVLGGSEDDGVFRGRGCERRVWARRLEEERRPCEDIAFLLQRAVGGGETALRGGKRGDDHEVSILIGVGDGERAG